MTLFCPGTITVGTTAEPFDLGLGFTELEALVLGRDIDIEPETPDLPRQLPFLPAGLKMLDILSPKADLVLAVLRQFPSIKPPPSPVFPGDTNLQAPQHAVRLEELEHLRILANVDPCQIGPIVDQATKLQVLELGDRHVNHIRRRSAHPVERFDPVALPGTIRAVGMHGWMWTDDLSYHSSHTGRPFLDWVAKFPVTPETVSCYPEPFDTAGEAVLSLVRMKGVKTIFQNCLRGILRDKVLKEAKQRGVVVHHTVNPYRPPIFPWPAEE